MKYKLTIWHHLKDETSANSLCEAMRSKEIANIKIVWIRSLFCLEDDFDYRRLYVDVDIPNNPSIMTTEKICECFFENWSDAISYIKFESQYPCSWETKFGETEKIKNSGRYVEVECNKSVSRAIPFSENTILMANRNFPFYGGVFVGAPYSEESYHSIEENLIKLGLCQISSHNLQKKCYKVDFSTNVIKGATLVDNGWYCDELGTWRNPKLHAELVYPNDRTMQRESKWYENEREWKIKPIKQNTFFDYSDDDSSLNPAFW